MNEPSLKHKRTQKGQRTVSIIGTGSYVPEKVLTNADLEKMVETSDEWITSRTGIKERRIASAEQATSDLAAAAAEQAIQNAGITAEEIDLILVATISPDMFFPATACFVQKKIGAKKAACFDLSAACAGFLYALEIAQQFITSHTYDTILVIGAEKLTTMVDWSDRNTCVLFGDGAGAAILRNKKDSHGVIATFMASDGAFTDILAVPAGGSRLPISCTNVDQKLNTIKMAGKEVFKQAVYAMCAAASEALKKAGLTIDDIACVIPHQANIRIIEAISDKMKVPLDRFYINVHKYGNTSAAAIAIALDEAHRTGKFKSGDYILLVAFGSGLTWASTVIHW